MTLADRTVLITGAGGHLGQALAQGLAAAGARVLLNGRSVDPLRALADAIARQGGQAEVLAFDVTDPEAARAAIAQHAQSDAPLHGLVNNAYSGTSADLLSLTPGDFAEAARINLGATVLLTQLTQPLLAAKGGAIVNIASMYGHVSPDPTLYPDGVAMNPAHYGATKAGLLQLTRYMAVRLASSGIRVNSVSPGPFPNPDVVRQNPEFIRRLEARVPLARVGRPHELVGAVAFLLSDAASYITGADIPVDGGWCAI